MILGIAAGINHHDQAALAAELVVDAEVVEMSAVRQVDIGALVVRTSQHLVEQRQQRIAGLSLDFSNASGSGR